MKRRKRRRRAPKRGRNRGAVYGGNMADIYVSAAARSLTRISAVGGRAGERPRLMTPRRSSRSSSPAEAGDIADQTAIAASLACLIAL